MASLEDLLTVRTADEVFADYLVSLAAQGQQAAGWPATSIQYCLTKIAATDQALAETIRLRVVNGGYLDTATGAWLTLLAKGFFNLDRAAATATIGTIRITDTAAAGPLDKSARQVRLKSASGAIFENTGVFHVNASGYADVEFVCTTPGTAGNASTSTTWYFLTSLPGFTATNPAVGVTGTWITTPGVAEQSDESLRTQCKAQWSTLGAGGNAAAVGYRITTAQSALTRWYIDDANPNGSGSVDVYLATAAGTASDEQVAAVLAYLTPRKAVGTGELRCFAAPVNAQTITATVVSDGTRSSGEIETDADQAIADLQGELGLGATLYVAEIVQRLQGIAGVIDTTVAAPAANVVPGAAEAFVLTLSLTVTE